MIRYYIVLGRLNPTTAYYSVATGVSELKKKHFQDPLLDTTACWVLPF